MRVLGAILAGGESRRFGSDKAVAMLGGRTLLDHVADRLGRHVADVVLCGRTTSGFRCLPDRPAPGLGPLGGICAALRDAQERGFNAVFTTPCDAPLLPDNIVARLIGSGAPSYVVDLPVVGLWPAAAAQELEQRLLGSERRAVRGWASAIGARPVEGVGIANVNTPEDLAALARSSDAAGRAWT